MTGNRQRTSVLVLSLLLAARASAAPVAAPDAAPVTPSTVASTPAARTLFLVRHGAYDDRDPADARVGKALVPIGVAQARLVAARLAGLPPAFDEILASPLTRAHQTAAVIAAELHAPAPTVVEDLAECTPATRRADVMANEKAEDLAACAAQIDRLAKRLLTPAIGQARREVVVCHGNIIRSLVVRALGVDVDSWLGMSLGHASLTVITVDPRGGVRLVSAGDVGHLPLPFQTGTVLDAEHDLTVPQP